jgi:hypothetical protein
MRSAGHVWDRLCSKAFLDRNRARNNGLWLYMKGERMYFWLGERLLSSQKELCVSERDVDLNKRCLSGILLFGERQVVKLYSFSMQSGARECYKRIFSNSNQCCIIIFGLYILLNLKFTTPVNTLRLWPKWSGNGFAERSEYLDIVRWSWLQQLVTTH